MKELVEVSTRREADEILLILHSQDLAAAVVHKEGRWQVRVEAACHETARALLADEGAVGNTDEAPSAKRQRRRSSLPRKAAANLTPQPPGRIGWVILPLALNVALWLLLEANGGSQDRATLIRYGAAYTPRVASGEWWRLVTAVFIHIGAAHLIANSSSLIALGALALRRFGSAPFAVIYVASGIGGNIASYLLGASGLKAGASGAILGLLGALVGRRLNELGGDREMPRRFKRWHVIAMAVAFYGFVVGFGRVDHIAHLGGLLVGAAVGWAMPTAGESRSVRRRWSIRLAAGAVVILVAAAGWQAWLHTTR